VLLTGDTLRGEVDLRSAQRNARFSRFRSATSATVTEYRPQQLKGYGYNNDQIYQTETVVLNDSSVVTSLIESRRDSMRRPVFLEVIVRGPATLLFLRDRQSNVHYYLKMQAGKVQELVQTNQQVRVNGVAYEQKSLEYQRTLSAAMQSCLTVQPAISHLRYALNDIAEIVRRYNECTGTTSIVPANVKRSNKVELELIVGGQTSQLLVYGDNIIKQPHQAAIKPVIGIALDFHIAQVDPKLSVRLEALYENQSFKYDFMRFALNNRGTVELSSMRLPLLVRYTFPRGTIRPFMQAGGSVSYIMKANTDFKVQYPGSTPPVYTIPAPLIKDPRKIELGVIGGIGLTTARNNARNLGIEFRYERSNGFSDYINIGTRLNRYYLLLSYDLTR
jgi:hypothetical protein